MIESLLIFSITFILSFAIHIDPLLDPCYEVSKEFGPILQNT